MIDDAMKYIVAGLAVIPLRSPSSKPGALCDCNDAECSQPAKHPRTMHGSKDASLDPFKVADWWDTWPHANIGIATGEISGIVVLDVDPKNGGSDTLAAIEREFGSLPESACVITGSGGRHYYFKHPGEPIKNTQSSKDRPSYLGAGLDLRGDGGYVVAPPSIHYTGAAYAWLNDMPSDFPSMPEWLLNKIRKHRDKFKTETNGHHGGGDPLIPAGSRHPQMLTWAAAMRRVGLSESAINAALQLENKTRFVESKDPEEVEKVAAWIGQRDYDASFLAIPRESAVSDLDDELFVIDTSCNDLAEITDQCWTAITARNRPPVLFANGTAIVRITKDDRHQVYLQPVSPEIIRNELSRWAVWQKRNHKGEMTATKPTTDLMRDVLAVRDIAVKLPRLVRITNTPGFGPDGTLQTEPGYNPQSGIYYTPPQGFRALPLSIPASPDDLYEAKKLIEEVIKDFPFASEADKQNAIALMILPFVRDMIQGPTPNHLIEASMPGSGKGMLASACLLPGIGDEVAITTQPKDEDEWRKKITSLLCEGRPAIMIDNVSRMMDSGVLAAALTADYWSERIIGTNQSARIPIRAIWVTTGNNITISSELARRSPRIRLTPNTDRPEERRDFEHPALLAWMRDRRPEIIHACHVLVQWWLDHGKPSPMGTPVGSYESWFEVVGGILQMAGYMEFLGNYREFQAGSDSERTARALFCETWYLWATSNHKLDATASDLLQIADNVDFLPIYGNTEKARLTSLGKYLKASQDVICEYTEETESGEIKSTKYKITRGKIQRGRQYYKIEVV